MQVRPAHLRYLQSEAARIKVGGCRCSISTNSRSGSPLIVEAKDRDAVAAFAECAPGRRQGVFERVEIRAWRAGAGAASVLSGRDPWRTG